MVDAYTSMRVRLLPPFSWMHTNISLSLIGEGLISWAASQLAKPTPAVLSSPPPQKIVWLFSIIFPAGRSLNFARGVNACFLQFTTDKGCCSFWSYWGVTVAGCANIPGTQIQMLFVWIRVNGLRLCSCRDSKIHVQRKCWWRENRV